MLAAVGIIEMNAFSGCMLDFQFPATVTGMGLCCDRNPREMLEIPGV